MEELFEISQALIARTDLKFIRGLYNTIHWPSRLIGIKGSRGTGKTTMLLQYLKQSPLPPAQKLYLSLDDIYFTSHTLLAAARLFYTRGGKLLVLDEVHKYPAWAQEIKNIYDRYPDLQIVFTGSSIIDITNSEADLSRRAVLYELHGLSFREYLHFAHNIIFSPITLAQLTAADFNYDHYFPAEFQPYQYFSQHVKYGYYPFALESSSTYYLRLQQLVRTIVEVDMAEIKSFDIRQAHKILQLLHIISQQVPFSPNLSDLARKTGIHRNSLNNYLYYLQDARLIRLLTSNAFSVAALQKPEKIFLDNTNLLYALSHENPNEGTLREAWFYSQLAAVHKVNYPAQGDFLIDNKYTFEVGGSAKTARQIQGIQNSFVVKDLLVRPAGSALPLWLFGFLY